MKKGRFARFVSDIYIHTPFLKMVVLLIVLWVSFSSGLYLTERSMPHASVTSLGEALYWGVAAFSTAGIADTPTSGIAQILGGVWIVLGSALFFGTIVATITTYFSRPLKHPVKQIVDTIEYNLEQLDELSIAELDLLKKTVDSLILHMEKVKEAQYKVGD